MLAAEVEAIPRVHVGAVERGETQLGVTTLNMSGETAGHPLPGDPQA
ncbi:hypothetical protein SALBM311S_10183 [Streptomyces alboniger]